MRFLAVLSLIFFFSFCYIEGAYRVRGGRRNERKSFWFSTLVFLVFGILFLLCGFGNWVYGLGVSGTFGDFYLQLWSDNSLAQVEVRGLYLD